MKHVWLGLACLVLAGAPMAYAAPQPTKADIAKWNDKGDEYYNRAKASSGRGVNENFEKAEHKLTIQIDAALGSIKVQWVDGSLGSR